MKNRTEIYNVYIRVTLKLKSMKRFKFLAAALLASAFIITGSLSAQNMENTKMVGGAAMYPSKNIVENAVNSNDHTTLVAAVKAADLVSTLESDGPFTVFAPTNEAFNKLPEGTVASLLKPENKKKLQAVLTYHVIAGNFSAADIMTAIKKGHGKATFKTVQGEELTAMMNGKNLQLKDAGGNVATVTIADVNQSNGVIHVIDTVLLP